MAYNPKEIECSCGKTIVLYDPMTNECDCGAFYNGCGNRLAPPRQWGWETGEEFDNDGNQIGFIDY